MMSDELRKASCLSFITHHSAFIIFFLRLNGEALDARGSAVRVRCGDDELVVAGRELVGRNRAGVLDAPVGVGRWKVERALGERVVALRDFERELRRGLLAARGVG